MASKSKVYFFFDNVSVAFRKRNKLKTVIGHIFQNEKKNLGHLNYIFCSDKKMLSINRQYLKHDNYTDIITFDLSRDKRQVTGEIYISTDRVKENAKKYGSLVNVELHRVILHGALHLCGYRDKSTKEKKKMKNKEDSYLAMI